MERVGWIFLLVPASWKRNPGSGQHTTILFLFRGEHLKDQAQSSQVPTFDSHIPKLIPLAILIPAGPNKNPK